MSETTEHHEYFGTLVRDDELGGWTGSVLFPPTKTDVPIYIPGDENDFIVPIKSVSFFNDVISLYPEISQAIQNKFYEMRDSFEELKSKDDVWSIFQLEGIDLDVVNLTDSTSWNLIFGTDYGGHIFEFQMSGKDIVSMSQHG